MGAMLYIKDERTETNAQYAIDKASDAWEVARILLSNNQVTEITISLYGEDYGTRPST